MANHQWPLTISLDELHEFRTIRRSDSNGTLIIIEFSFEPRSNTRFCIHHCTAFRLENDGSLNAFKKNHLVQNNYKGLTAFIKGLGLSDRYGMHIIKVGEPSVSDGCSTKNEWEKRFPYPSSGKCTLGSTIITT